VVLNKYCLGEHIKEIEIGRTFGTHGRQGTCVYAGFCLENLMQPDSLEDSDVDWGIVLKWILKQEVWRI
jgi:hypothetical protein